MNYQSCLRCIRSLQRLVAWRTACVVVVQFMGDTAAAKMDPSQHHIVEFANGTTYTQLSSPSVNGKGDVAFRAVLPDNSRRVMTKLWNSSTSPVYAEAFVQASSGSGTIATPFPDINDDRTVAFSRTETGEFGSVRRRLYDPGSQSYAAPSEAIAEWDLISPYSKPFRLSSVLVSLANNGSIAFSSTASGTFSIYEAIFAGSSLVTSPSSAIVVEESVFGIDSLDTYVDASNSGWVVRGSNVLGELGVFRVTTPGSSDRITPAGEYLTLGARPSINDSGTIAFSGTKSTGPGVFLSFLGNSQLRDTTQLGVKPISVDNTVDKVAINKFNQVAYLGTNVSGKQALFSTNMGATREIVAVGDLLNEVPITSLRLHDGIMNSGQLAYLATTSGGQYIVRTNRGYTQGALRNSPILPSWADEPYLLRSQPSSGLPDSKTIGSDGCNLTSTVNLLSYFGVDTTPIDFQNWLLDKHLADKGSYVPGSKYINEKNDFVESVVLEFSREQGGLTTVRSLGVYTNEANNRNTLISQLQSGRPVKVHVPNRTKAAGHYILAYGLKDPSALANQITDADILVHDPGNPTRRNIGYEPIEINTLADYTQSVQQIRSATSQPALSTNWLNDRDRLHLYEVAVAPNASQVSFSVFSPVEIVLTSPTGEKVGIDPSLGNFNEIIGANYYEETPYTSIDDEEPVWLDEEPIKHLLINDPQPGNYQLEVIGTGTGSYDIILNGGGNLGLSMTSISGITTPGQRSVFSISISHMFSPSLAGDFNENGIVDAADYVVWRKNEGTSNDLPNDTTGVDTIGSAQYTLWRNNFGSMATTGSSAHAIPEPSAILCLTAASLAAFFVRRRA